jgi:glycerol uptake facilitator-like aquaporin
MQNFDLPRRLVAEALGTALLVATVVGSGIMAESLTKDVALALLGNTLPTGAILVVLITILGPISGAHFNPAVSLIFGLKRELTVRDTALYVGAQVAGGILGTMIAHGMFALPLLDASMKVRTGGAQWFAEAVAAFGLVATILAGIRFQRAAVPWLVGLYITAARRHRSPIRLSRLRAHSPTRSPEFARPIFRVSSPPNFLVPSSACWS